MRSSLPDRPFAGGREGGVEFGELGVACSEARRGGGAEHWVVLDEKEGEPARRADGFGSAVRRLRGSRLDPSP